MLIFLLALAVTAGGAFAQDDNGSWSFSGEANFKGGIELPKETDTDNTGGSSPASADTPLIKGYGDSINGSFTAIFSKTTKTGADFTAELGFEIATDGGKDVATEASLKLDWAWTLGAGKLKTSILLNENSNDEENGTFHKRERIDLRAGYSEETFGVNLGIRTYWAELFAPFLPGYADDTASFREEIFHSTHLNGWVKTLDDQLIIDFRYKEGPSPDLRASKLVSRSWTGGDQSIGFTFSPDAVDGLTTALTVKVRGDNDDTVQGGIASQSLQFAAGARYDLGDMSFSLQYANGYTSGDLWENEDDRKAFITENGFYPDFLPRAKADRRGGLNAGFKMGLGDLNLEADVQILGLNKLEYYGLLGFGVKADYNGGAFGADATFKLYTTLWDGKEMYGGKKEDSFGYIIAPINAWVTVVPDTITARLNVTIEQGLANGSWASDKDTGYEGFDKARSSLKVAPKLEWSVNSNGNTKLSLEYVIKFDTAAALSKEAANQHTRLKDHNITLGFSFSL